MGMSEAFELRTEYQEPWGADAVQGEVHESGCWEGNTCHGYCEAC